jgi:flagellar biosynthesis chaperone FliJ
LQLAAGGSIEDVISNFEKQITAIASQSQEILNTIRQNVQSYVQNATSNAVSQAEASLDSFQKNVSDTAASAKEAEAQIQACTQDLSKEYEAVLNTTSKYT